MQKSNFRKTFAVTIKIPQVNAQCGLNHLFKIKANLIKKKGKRIKAQREEQRSRKEENAIFTQFHTESKTAEQLVHQLTVMRTDTELKGTWDLTVASSLSLQMSKLRPKNGRRKGLAQSHN